MKYNTDLLAKRLDSTFRELVAIDSESRSEGELSALLSQKMQDLGMEVVSDNAAGQTGSDCGNLVGFLPGSRDGIIMLGAHMDTVTPGRGVKVIFKDGSYKTDGKTILAADDKSGLAIILEAISVILENDLPRPGLEALFTVCEEDGLLGVKHLDFDMLRSKCGIILDSTNADIVITRAPAANALYFKVKGMEAHAGVNPEDGINAIQIAAKAIAGISLGRIDAETTANIGIVKGGRATNIVPSEVIIEGEVRSHNLEKLAYVTSEICRIFEEAAAASRCDGSLLPLVDCEVRQEFPALKVDSNSRLLKTIMDAGCKLGRILETGSTGGGSDANILSGKGIDVVVMGTGMKLTHSVEETIRLDDMVKTTMLLVETILSYQE